MAECVVENICYFILLMLLMYFSKKNIVVLYFELKEYCNYKNVNGFIVVI